MFGRRRSKEKDMKDSVLVLESDSISADGKYVAGKCCVVKKDEEKDMEDFISKYSVKAARCKECGKLHEFGKQTYVTFYGNFELGGEYVGDHNIDASGRVVGCSVYCRNASCLKIILKAMDVKVEVLR
jgi:hypothetical protein